MTIDPREQWQRVRALDTPGTLRLGPNTFDRYINDPKRIAFMLSRYKFAAKMLRDCDTILDVGCGDGFGTLTLIRDTHADVTGIDFDADLIGHAMASLETLRTIDADAASRLGFMRDDYGKWTRGDPVAGVCCLDVIEHVPSGDGFLSLIRNDLRDGGIAVIGTPNALAAQYASPHSRLGHINLYTPDRLRAELKTVFRTVFLFSMNDEIVHTGFDRLAHYLIGVAVA